MATYRNRRGGVVVSELTHEEAASWLRGSVDTFARSLARDFRKWGRFTEEQKYWAHKLANEARRAGQAPPGPQPAFSATPRPVSAPLPAPVAVQAPAAPASFSLPGMAQQASQADEMAALLQGHPPEVLRLMARLASLAGLAVPGLQPHTQEEQPTTAWPAVVSIPVEPSAQVTATSPEVTAPETWEAETAVNPALPAHNNVAPKPVELGANVFQLFQNAKSKLKFPKIHFGLEVPGSDQRRQLVLSVAGPKSKRPGVINVTSEGGYGKNTYYGYVGTDGVFYPYNACDQAIVDFMLAFAADPVGVARAYGRKTGKCCFCDADLKTTKVENGLALYAVDLGYGKQCAKNWGLPYGLAAADPALVAAKGKGKSKSLPLPKTPADGQQV